ncbi:MAG: polysaccharide deacetylase family protein [Geminicoccaceae bacterium]|nr:polysaccharide deacetylase family protein [Geminicoccaceae bacterium]MCX7629004.1 polysaccharide deacetylase family protein [Geminicoccaceae bacterium]MDW8340470.1 polysaccharide deacetylase family protein [Geminicoccaceae bacterium]
MSSPGNARRVLVAHLDDVGMCHGANRAMLELAGVGVVTCGSVMVPCPWFPEIAHAYRTRRDLDLGVHLTLTSEWQGYRWRPLIGVSRKSGLVDDEGYMWRNCVLLRRHVDPQAAEEEMRAQIEAALCAGIDVTHLDTHMGAAAVPELVDIYLRLGREYRLPVLLPREITSYLDRLKLGAVRPELYRERLAALEAEGAQFVDRFRMTPGVPSSEADAAYRALVAELPPGVTFFSLHANAPGDIEAIVPDRAHWRTDEYRILADPDFAAFVRAQGIELAGMRVFRARLRAGSG